MRGIDLKRIAAVTRRGDRNARRREQAKRNTLAAIRRHQAKRDNGST